MQGPVDCIGLVRAVNAMIGPSVVVRSAAVAPPGFDARRSARARSYRYLILQADGPDPLLAPLAWHVRDPLDMRAMAAGADALLGEHDFRAFCRRPPGTSPGDPINRRVLDVRWREEYLGPGRPGRRRPAAALRHLGPVLLSPDGPFHRRHPHRRGWRSRTAFLLSNLALRPLTEISRQLDRLSAAEGVSPEGKAASKKDVAALVSTKIERIGQRMRNVEEVYSALRENLDQILGNLQDGILLFTEDKRAVLVSEAARRFLGIDRDSVLGRPARDIFPSSTVLGRALRETIDAGANMVKEEIRTENGRRIQASVDFIYDDETHRGLGALVTLHDLESAEKIESELELSRRMAAIGRLTSGVGHEVKNPINAIVVHLELLKSKLGDAEGPATRHLEVIDAEIRRLDRVVQTLVDFSRPVELQLHEQDLRLVIGDVLALSADELTTRRIQLIGRLPEEPLIANVDADLLKQAVLNVIQNGAQAMPEGGRLEVTLEEDRSADAAAPIPAQRNGIDGGRTGRAAQRFAVLRIADEGPGIPAEIREKIFDLYFTTKTGGSGIGLAMTYRILQLHHGSVEVQSRQDRGTEFLLRIPITTVDRVHRVQQPASMRSETELEK